MVVLEVAHQKYVKHTVVLTDQLFCRCKEMNPALLGFQISLPGKARITGGQYAELHEVEVLIMIPQPPVLVGESQLENLVGVLKDRHACFFSRYSVIVRHGKEGPASLGAITKTKNQLHYAIASLHRENLFFRLPILTDIDIGRTGSIVGYIDRYILITPRSPTSFASLSTVFQKPRPLSQSP